MNLPVSLTDYFKKNQQYFGSGMFIPDRGFEIFQPGSSVKKTPDPVSGSATKNLSYVADPGSF